MGQSQQLLDALKRVLKARGLRYADLARALDVSEATIKRQLSRGSMDLERLERICEWLQVDFFELARAARRVADTAQTLSLAQETALAAEPRLLMAFHLLCNEWSVAAIRAEFGLSAPKTIEIMAQLDRLALIDLLPGDQIRLRVARDIAWRSPGPVRQRYAQVATGEFLRDAFEGRSALLALEVREIGDASLAVVRRKLERLAVEFNELAEIDAGLPPRQRHSVGMLLALRPWVFSLLDSLRAEGVSSPANTASGRARRR
jgi:transcriptional regulator with XRE-family HTH domain